MQLVQEEDVCPLYKIRGSSQAQPLRVSVEFDNQVVDMKVDTGAACSLMSEVSFRELWPSRKLSKADLRLCTGQLEKQGTGNGTGTGTGNRNGKRKFARSCWGRDDS